MRRRLGIAAAVTLALLAGCSRVKMAWRLGPWLLERDVAQELAWPDAERAELKAAVKGWVGRVARQALPPVAAQARLAAARLSAGSDAAAAEALFDGGLAAWRGFLSTAMEPALKLLAREPAQRAAALERWFQATDLKDGKRWGDPDHSAVDQAKKLMATFKDWCGEPTDAQGPMIVAWARDARFPGPAYLAWRQGRQKALVQALRQGADPARLKALLQDLWLDQASQEKPLKAALKGYRERLRGSLAGLLKSLTADQRAQLTQRLEALAQDLDAVSADARAQAP
jgi:hypothetical protein